MTELVEAALEIDNLVLPQPAQQLDLLLEAPRPGPKVDPERLVLHAVPADADTEAELSPGEDVDLRCLLRDKRRLALRQHEDPGRELEARRAGGQEAEEHEWLMEWVCDRVVELLPRMTRRVRPENMVEGKSVPKPKLLHALNELAQLTRVRPHLALRENNTDLHPVSLLG